MRNYIKNSRFRNGQAPGVVHAAGKYVANQFFIGPGVGGTATVSFPAFQVGQTDVPGNPETFLRTAWTTAPTAGETQYNPGFRWTWLEHHIFKCPELFGQTIRITGSLRVAVAPLYVIPIVWANWNTSLNLYDIWDQPGISLTTTNWTPFDITFAAPNYPLNKVLDTGHYLGFGFDFDYQTAPQIDVSELKLWMPGETVAEMEYAVEAAASMSP